VRKLAWSPSFKRAFSHYVKRHPEDRERIIRILNQLQEEPFADALDTHKLKGALARLWSCSASYNCRIVFKFKKLDDEEDVILLIDIGTHGEVY
jgi:mRNA interferase YafQ